MSNYDKLLREKDAHGYFDGSQKELHWKAMEELLQMAPPPPAPKPAGGSGLHLFKWLLLAAGLAVATWFVYKQLTKTKKEFNGVLKPSNIPSQYFTINSNSDTVLRTSHASKLTIKKGTFKTDKPVTIEIKEVFTPDEILLSGLTTLSGGKPLKSAGMLYFNATTEGEKIEPSIPVDAFIAAKDKDPDMQLFKGEMQSDSTVDWVKPAIITDTTKPLYDLNKFAAGKALFQAKCASCHRTFYPGTGPALRNVQYRGPWKDPRNLLRWINNPAAFMATDLYTQDLKRNYGSMMTAFPELTQMDVENMLVYLNNVEQEDAKVTAPVTDTIGTPDSAKDCGYDTTYYSVQNTFEEYDTAGYGEVFTDTTDAMQIDPAKYDGIYRQGYDFQITDNGWYNIDAFLKTGTEDAEDVQLSAEIVNGENLPYNVYVFVPSERVLQSYTQKKGNIYRFSFSNNKIPLPLRYRAVLFAFGSKGQRILYGAAEFTIQREQQIKVELKETTKDGLLNVLYTNNINGVSIDAVEKEMNVFQKPCPGEGPSQISVADSANFERMK